MGQAVESSEWDEISNTLKTILSYDYASTRQALRNLYEKAKQQQWNAAEDIDWDIEVDVERGILNDSRVAIYDTPLWYSLDEKSRRSLNYLESAWTLSQVLHGEQGTLLGCGQLVDCVPHMDAKLYAASQTFDEARHVEVFERYLNEKLGGVRPIDKDLKYLFDIVLSSEMWQVKCLSMQVLFEGLALGAFHSTYDSAYDPLIRQIVSRVITDEARHVAFGVIALREEIPKMPEADRMNLEDFCLSACQMMATGFFPEEIYREVGFDDMQTLREVVMQSPARRQFQRDMFSVTIPNLKRIGLLSDRVRPLYEQLGVLQYEDLPSSA